MSQIAFTNGGARRMFTTKAYDLLNRLTNITSTPSASSAPAISFAYGLNSANQRTSVTNSDLTYWIYTYDNLGQVTSGKKYWADGTPVAGQQFEYAFDDIGNRKTNWFGGDESSTGLRPVAYSVNSLNQHTGRTNAGGYVNMIGTANANSTVTLWTSDGGYAITYRKGEYYRGELSLDNSSGPVYTTVTNLAVLNDGNNPDIVTATYGGVFVPKTPELFTHDLDGNLTSDGRWTNTWDGENRLIRMVARTSVGPQQRLEFEYDWKGRRIRKKVWNNTAGTGTPALDITFLYDGWNLIAELNSSHSTLRTYMWGLDLSGSAQGAGGVAGLLAMADSLQGTHFVAFDGNGNVAGLVKASDGAVSALYEYEPFGEVLRATGPMAKANPFRFSTKYQDGETDLLYYGFRYYSPAIGRWVSRDEIEEAGGLNCFAFVENDPLSESDKLGLYPASSSGGALHVSDNEHENYLIFQLRCAPGYLVANIRVIYDARAMYHGLWTEYQQNPRHSSYPKEAAYTEHVREVLNDNFGGQVPPVPQGDCSGSNVEERAFMRTRLVSPGHIATHYRVAAELPYNIAGTQQLYVTNTRIDYDCEGCCGRVRQIP